MEPRNSRSLRENIGLRRYNSHHSISSLEDRTTLTTPLALFQRSNSTTSTDRSFDQSRPDQAAGQKIIFQTAPRRSSLSGLDINSSPRLVFDTSYGGKMEFLINKDENSIGRRDDNDIVLHDVKVSKRHAIIVKTTKG